MPNVTLKAWKAGLKPGMKLRCLYRWYWGKDKPVPAAGFEVCEFVEVRATQAIMKTESSPRSWMDYPRASELKATDAGFELYFPKDEQWGERSGILMSRYEYVGVAA